MGFHKRNITKEIILSNINNIDSLMNADAFTFDDWGYKFIKDLNIEERKIREQIKEDQKIISGCPDKHHRYKELKSLSETLISLFNNPSWLDIHFTQEKLGRFELQLEEMGVFEILKEKSIKSIIKYYETI